jgi:calcium-activated chloride channel regulator 4
MDESSATLYSALNGKVFFKSVNLVVPNTWRDGMCQTKIHEATGQTVFRDPDIFVTGGHARESLPKPVTLQSRGCGQPGDRMIIPMQFLVGSTWFRQNWTDYPAKSFVHEWVKLRYGIFDQVGYRNDPLYPNFHIFQV